MLRGTWVFRDPTTAIASPHIAIRRSGRPALMRQNPSNDEKSPPPISLIVVQVDWAEDEDGMYEKIARRFYKLENGKPGPKQNMDIKLLELGEY